MRRLLALAGCLTALAFAAPSGAARHDVYPLHPGSAGPRVCAAQWLLAGHKPSVYRGVSTFKGRPNCYFGARTAKAVIRAKFVLGFPARAVNNRFGRDAYSILTGRVPRPIGYVVRAARRKADEVKRAEAASRTYAKNVVQLAERELSYGVVETPYGCNCGPRVYVYQSFTGAYRAPWCASFVQAIYSWAGVGTFANRSAGVFYIVGYARSRGWLRATPQPGDMVAFVDRLGHIGIVEKVVPGGIYSIEGNASNRVLRRYHPLSNERPKVYIHMPVLERRAP